MLESSGRSTARHAQVMEMLISMPLQSATWTTGPDGSAAVMYCSRAMRRMTEAMMTLWVAEGRKERVRT